MRCAVLLLTFALAGCGSALVGPAAPPLNSSAHFGWQTVDDIHVGWLMVTDDGISCDEILDVVDHRKDAGDALWVALEKGPTLDWPGLYPGTWGSYPAGDGVEGRHAEVYFQLEEDVVPLTGNDVWVEVHSDGDLFKATLDTSLAWGLIVARDCGQID
mgnify:CR=1 FL=1